MTTVLIVGASDGIGLCLTDRYRFGGQTKSGHGQQSACK